MLFIHREDAYVDCRGLYFEDFLRNGFNGSAATVGDYALHLSTLFPDVRLKHYLESEVLIWGTHRSARPTKSIQGIILWSGES